MNVDLRPDDQDMTSGGYPHLCEKDFEDGVIKHTEYGITFGNGETTVTLWYRSLGERQMAMTAAELLVQR